MRKLMMAVAAVASLGLAAGCQSKQDQLQEKRQDVAEAQVDANKKIAEAEKEAADKRADVSRDSQEEVADAQKDVAEEKKDLAEAERDAVNDRDNDLNNDRLNDDRAIGGAGMAGQDGPDGRDGFNKDRDQLAKDQLPAANLLNAQGTLTSTLGKNLKLKDASGKELSLKIDDTTRVMHNGQAVKLDKFKEGTEVRASYVQDKNHDNVAREVNIIRPVTK